MSLGYHTMTEIWTDPYILNNLLTSRGVIDKLYEAMEQDDVAELTSTAYKILIDLDLMPDVPKERKSVKESTKFRTVGNLAFNVGELDGTLKAYNRALTYAPKNSSEFVLALSNRSVLLHKLNCFEACISDIDKCLALNCPERIVSKLKKRKAECSQIVWKENLLNKHLDLVDGFFNFKVKRHPQITCASTDIDVHIESGLPKIIAAKDISIGTIVAVETPFTTHIDKHNYELACYYCHKMSLNLIPCENCVVVLFCSEECKEKCMNEYHDIECKIIEVLELLFTESEARLAFKTALKMKKQCSWKEFIEASQKMGVERMRDTPINELFDSNNKFSMLSYDDTHANLIHGTLYNTSFHCAVVCNALHKIDFFPKPYEEKLDAMRAFARVVMNLRVSFPRIFRGQTAKSIVSEATGLTPGINNYLLAFSSRLKHCCEANMILLPLLNKVAVVAQRPIKKGDDITISYIDHWYKTVYCPPRVKNLLMFRTTHSVCACRVCKDNWSVLKLKTCRMTPELRRLYEKCRKNDSDFETTCLALKAFDSQSNTAEHYEIFKQFIGLLNFEQWLSTRNLLPEKLRPNYLPEQHRLFVNFTS